MGTKIRILLIDDHEVVRKGLCGMLAEEADMEVVGQSDGGEAVLEQIDSSSPDVILMDIKMPKIDGIQLAFMVKKRFPHCNIVMLTLYDEYLIRAMGVGASGYLLKDISRGELIQSIRQVYSGDIVISKDIARRFPILTEKPGVKENLPQVSIFGGETMLEEVQLVIPASDYATDVIRFIAQVEKALQTRILQVVGSWEEGTAVTAVLNRATPFSEIMAKLKGMNGAGRVEEALESTDASGFVKKVEANVGATKRARKTIFINFERDRDLLGLSVAKQQS